MDNLFGDNLKENPKFRKILEKIFKDVVVESEKLFKMKGVWGSKVSNGQILYAAFFSGFYSKSIGIPVSWDLEKKEFGTNRYIRFMPIFEGGSEWFSPFKLTSDILNLLDKFSNVYKEFNKSYQQRVMGDFDVSVHGFDVVLQRYLDLKLAGNYSMDSVEIQNNKIPNTIRYVEPIVLDFLKKGSVVKDRNVDKIVVSLRSLLTKWGNELYDVVDKKSDYEKKMIMLPYDYLEQFKGVFDKKIETTIEMMDQIKDLTSINNNELQIFSLFSFITLESPIDFLDKYPKERKGLFYLFNNLKPDEKRIIGEDIKLEIDKTYFLSSEINMVTVYKNLIESLLIKANQISNIFDSAFDYAMINLTGEDKTKFEELKKKQKKFVEAIKTSTITYNEIFEKNKELNIKLIDQRTKIEDVKNNRLLLIKENEDVEKQLINAESEYVKAMEKNNEQIEAMNAKQLRLTSLDAINKKYDDIINKLQSSIDGELIKIKEINTEKVVLIDERTRLEETTKKQKIEIDTMKELVSKIKEENESTTTKLNSVIKEYENQMTINNNQLDEINTKQNKIVKLENVNENQKNQIKKLDETIVEHISKYKEISTEKANLISERDQLRKIVTENKDELSKFKSENDLLKKDNDEVKLAVEEAKKLKVESDKKASLLQIELLSKTKELIAIKGVELTANFLVNEKDKELQETREKIVNLSDKLTELEEELKKNKEEKEILKGKIIVSSTEVDKLNAINTELNFKVNGLDENIKILQEKTAKSELEVKDKMQKISDLEKKLIDALNQLDNLNWEKKQINKEKVKLKSQNLVNVVSLGAQQIKKQYEIYSRLEEVGKLKMALEDKTNEKKNLQELLEKQSRDVNNTKIELDILRESELKKIEELEKMKFIGKKRMRLLDIDF